MLDIESVHVKNGRGRKWTGRPIFFGPVHFLKWTDVQKNGQVMVFHPKNQIEIIQNCTGSEKWKAVHFEKWTGPKKIG